MQSGGKQKLGADIYLQRFSINFMPTWVLLNRPSNFIAVPRN